MSAKVPSVLHSLPIRTTSKSEPADCAVAGEARAAPLSYAPTLQTTRVMTQFTRIAILGATGRMGQAVAAAVRSEEHTSELQSLMRISYAVFCLKKQNKKTQNT